MKIKFLNILSYPLSFAVRNSLTNQCYQKLEVSGFEKERKKVTSLNRDINPGDPDHIHIF